MKKEYTRIAKLTDKQKNANNKQWYKNKINNFASMHNSTNYIPFADENTTRYAEIRVNQNLYNNRVDFEDLKKSLNPYGKKIGEINGKIKHRDIISTKINAVVGMEIARPFKFKPYAVNPEATTRREQAETKMMMDYVVNTIMAPIKAELAASMPQDGNQESIQQAQQQLQEQLKVMTPEEVKKYMKYKHQDPADIQASEILNYLIQEQRVEYKMMLGMLDLAQTNSEIFYVGIVDNNPVVKNINPALFTADTSNNVFIQDGDYAVVEYRMTFSEVIQYFGKDLNDTQIQKIYNDFKDYKFQDFVFSEPSGINPNDMNKIKVLHVVWKDLRKIQILTYDDNGVTRKKFVSDDYELKPDLGDIELVEDWVSEVYEGWLLGDDIYVNLGPVESQLKNIDNPRVSKLPYYGIVNDVKGSLISRAKEYAYLYDAAIFHIERLMASDKGKKLLMNIKAVPSKFKLKEWFNYLEISPATFFDPTEEGNTYQDANTVAKVLDLSLISDIEKYKNIAEFVRHQIGIVTGIPEELEGRISPYATSGNTQQTVMLSSNILEVLLKLHSQVKKEVLNALLEAGRIAFRNKDKEKLTYILSDGTLASLTVDADLLLQSQFGIFVDDASKSRELRQSLIQLVHAALQNQKIELSDAVKIFLEEDTTRNIIDLEVAEEKRADREDTLQQQQAQQNQQLEQLKAKNKETEHKYKLEEIRVKEEERRKTEVEKAALLGASFNPDKDANKNGVNDYVELFYKEKELAQKDRELDIKEKEANNKLKIEKMKNNNPKK